MSKSDQIENSWSQHITRQKWLEVMGGEEYDYRHRHLGIEPKSSCLTLPSAKYINMLLALITMPE